MYMYLLVRPVGLSAVSYQLSYHAAIRARLEKQGRRDRYV